MTPGLRSYKQEIIAVSETEEKHPMVSIHQMRLHETGKKKW
jgi:hypothetical protein